MQDVARLSPRLPCTSDEFDGTPCDIAVIEAAVAVPLPDDEEGGGLAAARVAARGPFRRRRRHETLLQSAGRHPIGVRHRVHHLRAGEQESKGATANSAADETAAVRRERLPVAVGFSLPAPRVALCALVITSADPQQPAIDVPLSGEGTAPSFEGR
jgi:hypothetical protein